MEEQIEEVRDESGNLVGFRKVKAQGVTSAASTATAVSPVVTEAAPSGESPGFFTEAGRAIVGGVRDGVQELGNTAAWVGDSVMNAVGGDVYYTENDGFEWLTQEEVKKRTDIPAWQTQTLLGDGGLVDLPEVAENESTVGGIARGATQFLVGYATFSKALKVGKAATTLGNFGRVTAAGAVTDFATFDAHEDRFSDFLRDNFGLQDPITEFLAADEDDTILEGKLKNAVEGLGLGLAVDGVVRLASLFKKAKKVQLTEGDEAAAEVMNKGVAEIAETEPQLLQPDLFDKTTDPNLEFAGAGKTVVDGKLPMKGDEVKAVDPKAELPAAGEVTNANAKAQGIDPKPTKPVNTDKLTKSIEDEMNLRRTNPGGFMASPYRTVESDIFNFEKMDADVDVKDVMNMAAEDIRNYGIKDPTTFKQIEADARDYLADSIDVNPKVIDASLAKMAKDAENQQGLVIAGKQLMQSLAREVETLALRIDAGDDSVEVLAKFARYQQRLVEVSANLKSVITGAAQTTSAGRIRTTDTVTGQQLSTADIVRQMEDKTTAGGGRDKLKDLAKAIKLNRELKGGDKNLLRVVESGNKGVAGRTMDVINEMFINNILSGIKTHVLNILSNSAQAMILPGEKVLGGALNLDPTMMREGFRQYSGLRLAMADSIKAAWSSLKSSQNILDPDASTIEKAGNRRGAISYEGENALASGVINSIGTVIRIPSRFLTAEDEFFKQLNYRSQMYSRLMGEAYDLLASGKITKDQMAEWVDQRMKLGFDKNGAARSQVDLNFAREATFTNELRANSFSRDFQNVVNKHPALRLIFPFIRTPVNILRAAVQRTPGIHMLSKQMMEDMKSGDPRRVAAAKGKLALGSTIWASAIYAAYDGRITGSGPKDPAERAALMATGWRPYSFVVTGADGTKQYYEYRRFDPMATFFGIAADVATISGDMSDGDYEGLGSAMAIAMSNNLMSKTYLEGAIDAVKAFNDPDRYFASWAYGYASGMVPMSAQMREWRGTDDPYMREVRSFADAIMNTIPGLSDNLPPKRSWVTGQPIRTPKGIGQGMVSPVGEIVSSRIPLGYSEATNDVVAEEMSRLGKGFPAPSRIIGDVQLDTKQYSRLLELHGTVRIGRRTLYEALEHEINKVTYDKDRAVQGDVFEDPSDNPRVQAIQRIISRYRDKAKRELLAEYPEIANTVRENKRVAVTARREKLQGIAALGE